MLIIITFQHVYSSHINTKTTIFNTNDTSILELLEIPERLAAL